MSETIRLELQGLLEELELDISLCTTREQLIRANQRYLKLQKLLSSPAEH